MNRLTCSRCHTVYLIEIPEGLGILGVEEDTLAKPHERVNLCDGCYQKFMKWFILECPNSNDKGERGE